MRKLPSTACVAYPKISGVGNCNKQPSRVSIQILTIRPISQSLLARLCHKNRHEGGRIGLAARMFAKVCTDLISSQAGNVLKALSKIAPRFLAIRGFGILCGSTLHTQKSSPKVKPDKNIPAAADSEGQNKNACTFYYVPSQTRTLRSVLHIASRRTNNNFVLFLHSSISVHQLKANPIFT